MKNPTSSSLLKKSIQYVLILLLLQGASIISVAQPSTDINTYVLFANQSLHFKGKDCNLCNYGIIEGGNVGVSACAPVNGNNLIFGGPVSMPDDGDYVVGDMVRIDNELAHPTSIWRLYANETANGFDASVLRDPPVLPWAPCPLLDMSLVPFPIFSAGLVDVTVNTGGTLNLPPGDYKDLWVKDNGTLYLTAGIYNVNSFKVGKHVNIFTEDGVELRSETFMTFNNDCFVGPSNNVKFFVRSDGLNPNNDNSVQFSKNTEFHGNVFAPNGQLNLGHTTDLTGKFWANTIESDWNVNVHGPDECLPSATGGSLCGPGVIDFFAFGCPGCTDLKWYDDAVNGAVVANGGTYSPFLNTTTSFWVTCTANGVESPRIEVTGTINSSKTLSLTINKVVTSLCPPNQGSQLPTEWAYTSNIPGYANFVLPAAGGSIPINGIPPGNYTITETPVIGWKPSVGTLDCDFASSGAPNSVTFDFDPADCGEVFCSATFFNEPTDCQITFCPAPLIRPSVSRDINTYVLFAYDELMFKGGNQSAGWGKIESGDIGVNYPGKSPTGYSLAFGTSGYAYMADGLQAVAHNVRADATGSFYDLYANALNPSFAATIRHAGPIAFTTPIIETVDLPVFPFTPCRASTNAAANLTISGVAIVAVGTYRDVRINDNAVVTFGPGIYNMRNLSIGKKVTINVSATTELWIDNTFSPNDYLKYGNFASLGNKIYVGACGLNVNTTRATNFSHNAVIYTDYFAPTGWLDLGGGNTLYGHYWAQRITGDPNNKFPCPQPPRLAENIDGDHATDVVLFPNPNNGSFTIQYAAEDNAPCTISIIDMTGRIMHVENRESIEGINAYSFDLGNYAKGIYFIKVQSANLNETLLLNIQ